MLLRNLAEAKHAGIRWPIRAILTSLFCALQIQSFLVEPEMRRAELYREGNMTISKFLENFYEKKNTGY